MSKHSPGPWKWTAGGMGEYTRLRSSAGHTVARTAATPAAADAAIIAAAPRLLDLVRAVGDTPCPATYGMAPADKRLHEPGCIVCTCRLLAARLDGATISGPVEHPNDMPGDHR